MKILSIEQLKAVQQLVIVRPTVEKQGKKSTLVLQNSELIPTAADNLDLLRFKVD